MFKYSSLPIVLITKTHAIHTPMTAKMMGLGQMVKDDRMSVLMYVHVDGVPFPVKSSTKKYTLEDSSTQPRAPPPTAAGMIYVQLLLSGAVVEICMCNIIPQCVLRQ